MATGDNFLARWSRLKRGASPEPDGDEKADATEAPVQEPPLPDGMSLEDLLAELPKVEDLVPGQSLAAFMQPWVPTAIRNAALQRMWLLDPEISGYVNPALDYAYDYNALCPPPGFGPMEASQEMIGEVAQMFDRALGLPSAVEEARAAQAPSADPAEETADRDPVAAVIATQTASLTPAPAAIPAANTDAALRNKSSEPKDLRISVRRHGGALPDR